MSTESPPQIAAEANADPFADLPKIAAVGDSHTRFFATSSPALFDRMEIASPSYRLASFTINGASLTGLRSYASTLKMRQRIEKAGRRHRWLILNFGQVDLELGYYYRQVIKGESWTPDSYVDFLIGIGVVAQVNV